MGDVQTFGTNFDSGYTVGSPAAGFATIAGSGADTVVSSESVSAPNALQGQNVNGWAEMHSAGTAAGDMFCRLTSVVHVSGSSYSLRLPAVRASSAPAFYWPGVNPIAGTCRFFATNTPLGTGTFAIPTFADGTKVGMDLRVIGSHLYFKIWALSDPEPSAYQGMIADTTITAAGTGGIVNLISGTGVANPVADDYSEGTTTTDAGYTVQAYTSVFGSGLVPYPHNIGYYYDPNGQTDNIGAGDLVTITGPAGWRVGTYISYSQIAAGGTVPGAGSDTGTNFTNTTGHALVSLISAEGGHTTPTYLGGPPGLWRKTTGDVASQIQPQLVFPPALTVYPNVTGTVNVGFWGDSITATQKGTINGTSVDLIYNRLHAAFPNATVNVVNMGVSGSYTVNWLPTDTTSCTTPGDLTTNHFGAAVAAFVAAGVTVIHGAIGTNDDTDPPGVPVATSAANLQTINDAFSAHVPTLQIKIQEDPTYFMPDVVAGSSHATDVRIQGLGAAVKTLTGVTPGLGLCYLYSKYEGRFYFDDKHSVAPGFNPTGSLDMTYGGVALCALWCEPVTKAIVALASGGGGASGPPLANADLAALNAQPTIPVYVLAAAPLYIPYKSVSYLVPTGRPASVPLSIYNSLKLDGYI